MAHGIIVQAFWPLSRIVWNLLRCSATISAVSYFFSALFMKIARLKMIAAKAVSIAGATTLALMPLASHAYDFSVTAPTLDSSYQATMSGFVQTLPQYAFDLITSNLPMFLFFVFLSIGLGLYGWLRSKISHRR